MDQGMQMQRGTGAGAEVTFFRAKFPHPKVGANGTLDDEDEETPVAPAPTRREIVAQEAANLIVLQKRLSVRDLANKFEQGQTAARAAAKKVLDEVIVRDAVLMDRQSLLKKLRQKLEDLHGRAAGRNKDDCQEALSLVEALSVQVTQRENELSMQQSELRKTAAQFHQVQADAKKILEEAQALAEAEIETARAAVQRAEATLSEDPSLADSSELAALRQEVQEGRRIKMLHDSTKVMEMEHELIGLRQQLAEKTTDVVSLRKQLEALRVPHGANGKRFELQGDERLGSSLLLSPIGDNAPDFSACTFQWHRVSADGLKTELISGAVKRQYSPEPFDVGRFLQLVVSSPGGKQEIVSTSGPIDHAPGLVSYVDALVKKGGFEFNVLVIQQNGDSVQKQTAHVMHINKDRIKLRRGRTVRARETYAATMQLCGARGAGDAASQGLYWVAKKGLSFMLALASERERNAAIMLARRFAFDSNIMLAGPDDRAPLGISYDPPRSVN